MIARFGRLTRALCSAGLALQATACASRIFTDTANGVRHGLAVRSIAVLDAAYVESAHDGGLVLCGDVAVQPRRLGALGTRGVEGATGFTAYLSAAKLAGAEPALSYASFYARHGADCACLAKLEGMRAIAVGSESGVTLLGPAGVPLPEVTLEEQLLHIAALPGVSLRPVDLKLGPRGGNAAYFLLLPLALAWDGTFAAASFAVGAPLYIVSSGIRWIGSLVSPAHDSPPEPEPPRDPCAGIAGWVEPDGRR